MSELTPTERMDRVEALLNRTVERVNQLCTFEEEDEVVQGIFGSISDLDRRITALANNFAMVKETIT